MNNDKQEVLNKIDKTILKYKDEDDVMIIDDDSGEDITAELVKKEPKKVTKAEYDEACHIICNGIGIYLNFDSGTDLGSGLFIDDEMLQKLYDNLIELGHKMNFKFKRVLQKGFASTAAFRLFDLLRDIQRKQFNK